MTPATKAVSMNVPPLALTMGEPAGIGGEIALKAWMERAPDIPPFIVLDDPERLKHLAGHLGLKVPVIAVEAPAEGAAVFADALPVIGGPLPAPPEPGKPDPANTPAVLGSIEKAVELTLSGETAAVVTNPVHKKSLYDAGFPFPGHTEFLAQLTGGAKPVMMLTGKGLRVVPVTVHMSLRDAIGALDTNAIIETASITAKALRQDFGIPRPRLAVAGLNPHAGEGGGMGNEEETIIAPAIEALQARGIEAFGPVPPDTLFTDQARQGYDAAICMYHDQALIPIKTIDFEGAVNVTLGLPIVRTSPDHGTALDIAGRGVASEKSLIAALHLAAETAAMRKSGRDSGRVSASRARR